jgi:hypothetical protein
VPYPYIYHPFVPYYWGPTWYPIGFFAATLTTAAIIITVENNQYNYDDGVYYVKDSGGYKVVPAPLGATIAELPKGYVTINVSGSDYYYYGGTYYAKDTSKYKVVNAPVGAVVSHLPEGAEEKTIDGQKYMIYNNVYYQPISKDGQDSYVVVQGK